MKEIHLKAPRGWINDPNGFIYYNGEYHLFYQHFPYAARWGRMHWGHAVSSDLMNWKHLDIALFPTKTDDMDGCFSGSAIEKDGAMHLLYTGV
ncbi:MAG: glycoside hydrolase family 32 protein, partial [Oscillospiraceae bacterium]